MNLITLLLTLAIFAETTVLTVKSRQKPFLSANSRRKIYVDTSALMDVRLLAVAETGFIGDEVIIPRSVIHELQLLADGKDSDKRARARAALDTVSALERVVYFDVEILDDPLDRTPVDDRLLDLAKANRGLILTNDFNLNKVATAEHIDVLNINDLALALRGDYLPGEQTAVKIVAIGDGAHQGVGYLEDGTMVVVDRADKKVGETIKVEFIRLRQTAAGRMMFAKVAPSKNSPAAKVAASKISPAAKTANSAKVAKTSNSSKPSKISRSPKPSLKSLKPLSSAKKRSSSRRNMTHPRKNSER